MATVSDAEAVRDSAVEPDEPVNGSGHSSLGSRRRYFDDEPVNGDDDGGAGGKGRTDGAISVGRGYGLANHQGIVEEYRKEVADAGMGGLDHVRVKLAVDSRLIDFGTSCDDILEYVVVGPLGTIERMAAELDRLVERLTTPPQSAAGSNGRQARQILSMSDGVPVEAVRVFRTELAGKVGGADVACVELCVPDRGSGIDPAVGEPVQQHAVSGPRGLIEELSAALDRFVSDFCGAGGGGTAADAKSEKA